MGRDGSQGRLRASTAFVRPDRACTYPARAVVAAALALMTVSGCGMGSEINADAPCRDFLQAPLDEQNAAIARVADELGTRNALTPLGRPNINYLCSQNQNMTLGEAVESTG